MPEESTTPDLVERVSQQTEAANRGDVEAVTGFYAPDVVFDLSERGIGIFEGVAACRGFLDDYFGSFEELEWEMGETLVLDNGVLLAVVSQHARPVGVAAQVHTREGWVLGFSADGLMQSISTYDDIDQARAAAERLADERG
jgi:ketosteroid isomerase-like protein